MHERRRQPRKDLMSYSQVYDLNDGSLIGYLGDINQLGSMVISDHAITTHEHLSISIELPELPKVQEATLVVSVRVAWCHQDVSPDYYNLGLEFNTVTAKQRDIIQAVMENYEFRRQSPKYSPTHPNELDEE